MARLKAARRNKLPKSAFALPSQRKYPIDTKARAVAALAYAKRKNTAGSYSTVRAKVIKRYPSLKKTAGKSTTKRRSSAGRKRRR